MGNFAEILTNNQTKNINQISDEIGKKLEILTKNFSINKKLVRKAGKSHPPAEDESSWNGGSDLIGQNGQLVDTAGSPKVNFAINNDDSESEENDDDKLIEDIAYYFSAVEKTDPPMGKKLVNMLKLVAAIFKVTNTLLTCIDFLKTLGVKTNMDTKTELVNTKNNAAATTAKNIPSRSMKKAIIWSLKL